MVRSVGRPRSRAVSRIAGRLLAFNLLLLFLPVAAILYLDVYEARLLDTQESGMGQEARMLAAALSEIGPVDAGVATTLLARLGPRGEARLRIYDAAGTLLADSNRISSSEQSANTPAYPSAGSGIRERALYRLGAWIAGARRSAAAWTRRVLAYPRTNRPHSDDSGGGIQSEVRSALRGGYGAATRRTPGQRSLTLSVAVPIRSGTDVAGAVVVSQSTFRVLQALYDVRLRIFQVVIGSLVAAMLLTALAAATVVRPIRRLRDEASALAERRHRLPGEFPDATRRDELGDLARALGDLTRRLDGYIREAERFAGDVSHEFKNPLASIRVAAEMASQSEDDGERRRFLSMLMRDVDRLERLVSAVREQTRIDARLDQEPVADVDVGALLSRVIDGLRLGYGDQPEIRLAAEGACWVRASAERLAQAFENVLANARSFAPADSTVEVTLLRAGAYCRIEVADRGPGILAEHAERIFDRFFSYRPNNERESARHTGLGLSIARTIIEGYGGTIVAGNREGGGARFDVQLPFA